MFRPGLRQRSFSAATVVCLLLVNAGTVNAVSPFSVDKVEIVPCATDDVLAPLSTSAQGQTPSCIDNRLSSDLLVSRNTDRSVFSAVWDVPSGGSRGYTQSMIVKLTLGSASPYPRAYGVCLGSSTMAPSPTLQPITSFSNMCQGASVSDDNTVQLTSVISPGGIRGYQMRQDNDVQTGVAGHVCTVNPTAFASSSRDPSALSGTFNTTDMFGGNSAVLAFGSDSAVNCSTAKVGHAFGQQQGEVQVLGLSVVCNAQNTAAERWLVLVGFPVSTSGVPSATPVVAVQVKIACPPSPTAPSSPLFAPSAVATSTVGTTDCLSFCPSCTVAGCVPQPSVDGVFAVAQCCQCEPNTQTNTLEVPASGATCSTALQVREQEGALTGGSLAAARTVARQGASQTQNAALRYTVTGCEVNSDPALCCQMVYRDLLCSAGITFATCTCAGISGGITCPTFGNTHCSHSKKGWLGLLGLLGIIPCVLAIIAFIFLMTLLKKARPQWKDDRQALGGSSMIVGSPRPAHTMRAQAPTVTVTTPQFNTATCPTPGCSGSLTPTSLPMGYNAAGTQAYPFSSMGPASPQSPGAATQSHPGFPGR
eukprot:TRINITY_DN56450_c0_g1_i1.p1 TRINITY_DN56450_c0_g1~~TRINITY_DN56450_c0_g1_i1.p1  ORF type:complete len:592 (+),score=85.95 TRINITY_DN56450_c0_g1_i1:169-1944(+)